MSLMSAKKLLLGASRQIRPQDVFATTLYNGVSGNMNVEKTIVNGLNLRQDGGLVWTKSRNNNYKATVFDTVRGARRIISPAEVFGEENKSGIVDFTSEGYVLHYNEELNQEGLPYVSFSMLKKPKFLDIVMYTGDGNPGRSLTHNLRAPPGMILIKGVDNTGWYVWHRGNGAKGYTGLSLSQTDPAGQTLAPASAINAASFSPAFVTEAASGNVPNSTGKIYIAYLFAQNGGLIDCGSYVGKGGADASVICGGGWQPQFLLLKCMTAASSWIMLDTKRGFSGSNDPVLSANLKAPEVRGAALVAPAANGFKAVGTNVASNGNGQEYAYLAIRSPL